MNTLAAIARIATTRKSNEVAEVACRDKGNELSVTETGMSFDCPPPLTVILPEPPMSPAKNDAVRPSDATSTRPTDVVQVKLGTDTVFPYASVTTAVKARVPVAATLDWGALITTAAGGPARIATVIVAVGTSETPTAVIEMLTSGPVAVGAVYRNSRSSDDSRDSEPPPAVQVRCPVVTSLP